MRSIIPFLLGATSISTNASGCIGVAIEDESSESDQNIAVPEPDIQHAQIPLEGEGTLKAVVYRPATVGQLPAVIMLHGCTGMWSSGIVTPPDQIPNLQSHIDKWGIELARRGIVAVAVDSFSGRSGGQSHCNEPPGGPVDSYTVRVADAESARAWLRVQPGINGDSIALLGWSHGAQAAMTAAAAVDRLTNVSKVLPTGDPGFRATVLFYPGCGPNMRFFLGTVSNYAQSTWRPYHDVLLNIGANDQVVNPAYCAAREPRAVGFYNSTEGSGHWFNYVEYPGAHHSFDIDPSASQTWPTDACADPTDECARRTADIESMNFLINRITGEVAAD